MNALPLADELFLVGHDQYTGKTQVSDGALDTGLAGAVLGELVLSGRIRIDDDTAVAIRDRSPYGERVTDAAMAEILKQRDGHPVRAWVEYLRDHARTMVAPRVIQAGLIERVEGRSMMRQSVRYPAVDRIRAASAQARLHYVIDHPEFLDLPTAVLGGLVLATGLDHVIGGSPRQTKAALGTMLDQLAPDLRSLVVGVESAIAQLALSGRR